MRRVRVAGLALIALLTALAGGCSSSGGNGDADGDAVPRIEAAAGEAAEAVGSTFDASTLPAILDPGSDPDPLFGSVLLGSGADVAAGGAVAIHWVERGDRVDVVVSDEVGQGDAGPIWRIASVWVVVMDPASVFTVGTRVCKPDAPIDALESGELLVVVDREQDRALGAWTITRDGPTPLADPASLTCERFVP